MNQFQKVVEAEQKDFIHKFREKTGLGLMESKSYLVKNNWDFEKAYKDVLNNHRKEWNIFP